MLTPYRWNVWDNNMNFSTTESSIDSSATSRSPLTDTKHLTTVVVYVLLTFFTLFVLTGVCGLLGFIGRRLHRAHVKRRCSRRLIAVTKKALKTLALRTLRPTDQEIISGCDQCAVCIELYRVSDVVRILPCQHVFHKKCVDPWLLEHRSCPLCKLDILKACGVLLDSVFPLMMDDLESNQWNSDFSSSSSSSLSEPYRRSAVGNSCSRRIWSLFFGRLDRPSATCFHCAFSERGVSAHGCIAYPPSFYPDRTPDLGHCLLHKDHDNVLDVTSTRTSSILSACPLLWLCCCCYFWPDIRESTGITHSRSCSHCLLTRERPENAIRMPVLSDRLCDYHASFLGVSCMPVMIQLLHWQCYEYHRRELEQHLEDGRTFRDVSSTLSQPGCKRSCFDTLFSLKQVRSRVKNMFLKRRRRSVAIRMQSKLDGTQSPSPPNPWGRHMELHRPVVSFAETNYSGQCEQKVDVHYPKDIYSSSPEKRTSPVDASPHATLDIRVTKDYSKEFGNERPRLDATVSSLANATTSSSTDGSSEPSLVVLAPSSTLLNSVEHFQVGLYPHIGSPRDRTRDKVSSTRPRWSSVKPYLKRSKRSFHPYLTTYAWHGRSPKSTNPRGSRTTGQYVRSKAIDSKDFLRGLKHFQPTKRSEPKSENLNAPSDSSTHLNRSPPPPYHRMTCDSPLQQLPAGPPEYFRPFCPMCRAERARASEHHTLSTRQPMNRFFDLATPIHPRQVHHLKRRERRRQRRSSNVIHVRSFDISVHSVRRHSDDRSSPVDGSDNSQSAGDPVSRRKLCGVRVTIEPPEVQYHHNPQLLDSAECSPTDTANSTSSDSDIRQVTGRRVSSPLD